MTDWETVSSLATGGGTLVLAIATFASVRSANRAARTAELSLLEGLRPLFMSSRMQDPPEKFSFSGNHWVQIPGGHGHAEVTDDVIYFGLSLRNVGQGLGVLHGWRLSYDPPTGDISRPPLEEFRRLSRDLYVAPRDQGFWQGALRDPSAPEFAEARERVTAAENFWVDLLYGDLEGGQRTISRFVFTPGRDGQWLAAVVRHWNLDRQDPR